MSEMNGLLLAGDVYFDVLDDAGASTGSVGPVNCTQCSIETPSETKTRPSRKKANYGQALDTVMIPGAPVATLQFDDQPAELLALALRGKVQALNVASSTITDELATLPSNLRWAKLSVGNLAAAGITVKLASNDTELVAADFEINYALGMIRAAKGGSVEEGAAVKVTAQANAISGKRITGATRTQQRVKVYLDGTNLTTGQPAKLTIPETLLAPTQPLDLMASEFVSTTLAGPIKTLSTESAPFYLDQAES